MSNPVFFFTVVNLQHNRFAQPVFSSADLSGVEVEGFAFELRGEAVGVAVDHQIGVRSHIVGQMHHLHLQPSDFEVPGFGSDAILFGQGVKGAVVVAEDGGVGETGIGQLAKILFETEIPGVQEIFGPLVQQFVDRLFLEVAAAVGIREDADFQECHGRPVKVDE